MSSKTLKLQNNIKSDNMELDWKKVTKEVFIRLNIMKNGFTGSITFNCNQGGVVDYVKEERYT